MTEKMALQIAIERLEDILRQDDGQAYKEARKVLPELKQVLVTQKEYEDITEDDLEQVFRTADKHYYPHECLIAELLALMNPNKEAKL